jgi:hypothetical protein
MCSYPFKRMQERNHNFNTDNKSSESVAKFKHFETSIKIKIVFMNKLGLD